MNRDLTNLEKDKDELELGIANLIKDFIKKYRGLEMRVEIEQQWVSAGFNNDAFMTSLSVHVECTL